MRLLEVRRHSLREPTGPHLSAAGVLLARQVGPSLGRFDRVVTSPKPRAVETATELGFAVDAELPGLGTMPEDEGVVLEPERMRTFRDYADRYSRSATMSRYARSLESVWVEDLERIPDGGRELMISHGGAIECGAVAAILDGARTWGRTLGPLDGVRLYREAPGWVRGEVLRAIGP